MAKPKRGKQRPQRPQRSLGQFGLVQPFASREYGGVWNSAVASAVVGYGASPRLLTSLCPRLAALSDFYSQFKFISLNFHFIGRSSPNVTAHVAGCAMTNDHFGGTLNLSTEFEIKSSFGSVTIPAHKTGVIRFRPSPTWLSNDTDAGANLIGTDGGRLYFYTSATTAAGDAQWDLYVTYRILFRCPTAASVIN